MLQGIRERIPEAEIVAFTSRPEDTEARHGIRTFPVRHDIRPFRASSTQPSATDRAPAAATLAGSLRATIRRVPGLPWLVRRVRATVLWVRNGIAEAAFWTTRYKRMRRIDLLIVAGSNQLSDYFGGPWGFPYSVCAWSAAARMAGTRVAFLSVGAGPIRSPLSRSFIRAALAWSEYHSHRDLGSIDTIKALGVAGPHRVAPDLAQGLRIDVPRSRPRTAVRRTVVVNPLPYFDPRYWAEKDQAVYDRYVNLLAAFAGKLLERGYRVRFAPTQLRADPPVIADVIRALGHRPAEEIPDDRMDPPVATFEDLVALLAEADVVVATRFHGVVLAQLLGKPTIGIAYRRSTTDLLHDVGQGAYAIDMADLTLSGLLARLTALEADQGAAERIVARMKVLREALAEQYDLVLTPEGGPGAKGPDSGA